MKMNGETGGDYRMLDMEYGMPLDEGLFRNAQIDRSHADIELLDATAAVLPTNYPLLEHAQVLDLARVIQHSDNPAEVEDATETLVRHNTKLAFWGAQRAQFERVYMPFTDIVQAAMVGVYMAAKRFDPDRNLRFGNYAPYWMQTTIRKETARYVGVPRHVFDKFPATYRAAERLKSQLGRMPSIMDLANETGIPPRELANQMIYRQKVSDDRQLILDAPVLNDSRRGHTTAERIIKMNTTQAGVADMSKGLAEAVQRLDTNLDVVGSACLSQIVDGRKDVADMADQFDVGRAVVHRQYAKVQSLLRHPFYGVLAAIDPKYAWQEDALCRAEQNNVVVQERFQGQLQVARELCGSCAVRDQCMQVVKEDGPPVIAGIWAGKLPSSLQK